jgi:hypothetical protein
MRLALVHRILVSLLATVAAFPSGMIAQENSAESTGRIAATPEAILQELQNDVLRVLISARVLDGDLEEGAEVIWSMEIDELTVPGRGVNVRLNGDNIVVEVEFTPYRQQDQTIMLVAQGQTWVTSDEENKLRYQTSLKSIPINAGEPVVFYPLGLNRADGSSINLDASDGSPLNLELEITVTNFVDDRQYHQEDEQTGGN